MIAIFHGCSRHDSSKIFEVEITGLCYIPEKGSLAKYNDKLYKIKEVIFNLNNRKYEIFMYEASGQ